MKYLIYFASFIVTSIDIYAGIYIKFPTVGQLCPDFVITNVEFLGRTQIVPSEFRGKWLILDFFDKNCGACIAAFPRYNENQKKYNGKLQILLIGRQDKENQTRGIYYRYKQQKGLVLPCAFDSTIFNQLDIETSPFVIIVDPKGYVRYITSFFYSNDLDSILAGRIVKLRRVYRQHEPREPQYTYSSQFPFLINSNGGADTSFLFRSLLSGWSPLSPRCYPSEIAYQNQKLAEMSHYKFEVLGETLNGLYRYAYFGKSGGVSFNDSVYGKIWPRNVLEVIDSSQFNSDFATGKNYFCYSLCVPKNRYSSRCLMSIMQKDLQNYFNYEVSYEVRNMPYWALLATEESRALLATKGGKSYSTPNSHEYNDSIVIYNLPLSFFMKRVLPINTTAMPFIDETGIIGNIDVKLKVGIMPSLDRVDSALHSVGLRLEKKWKNMNVLVIRDANDISL